MKHINIVKTLCLFISGYTLISLIVSLSLMFFSSDSNLMLVWGALVGFATAYAFFKTFDYFDQMHHKKSTAFLCLLTLTLLVLQAFLNLYIINKMSSADHFVDFTRMASVTFAQNLYIVSLVIGGFYLGNKYNYN